MADRELVFVLRHHVLGGRAAGIGRRGRAQELVDQARSPRCERRGCRWGSASSDEPGRGARSTDRERCREPIRPRLPLVWAAPSWRCVGCARAGCEAHGVYCDEDDIRWFRRFAIDPIGAPGGVVERTRLGRRHKDQGGTFACPGGSTRFEPHRRARASGRGPARHGLSALPTRRHTEGANPSFRLHATHG